MSDLHNLKHWQSLAEQGDVAAQDRIGWMYENGIGVKQSYTEAYFWLFLARRYRGGAEAAKYLTPEQIAAVKKRLEEWKPTPAASPPPEEKKE